ncbi:DUF7283 family protein [Haloarcula salinisoli]|uniref:Uncharacterized protein n=1 Tax=Haloarcula salinisoli TaxID=2487746 RepID=A0A8J8C748_9EURY|nr:hypothetical protein [Halomicroarcula salinisoli]MBX0285592.1 hypothetical protein [Halomicroarcula salinisoli]MBX0302922.1 hypothetical protein [Halomicroarcula salinisoli]
MDFEAPVDAWYVWVGVAIASVAFAGIALSLPSQPPPDAAEAANTVDEVSGSSYNASATYEHDADEVKIDVKRIGMRNEGGTEWASIAFGTMTPVRTHPNPEDGLNIVYGEDPESVFANPSAMQSYAETARDAAVNSDGEWHSGDGKLRVRQVNWGGVSVTFVAA